MRHGPTELQSLPLPLDGRRLADAARSEAANHEHNNSIGARRGVVVLGERYEYMRDEMVRGWMGRHERVGTTDGGDGDDPGAVGQQCRAAFDCTRELEKEKLMSRLASPLAFVVKSCYLLPSHTKVRSLLRSRMYTTNLHLARSFSSKTSRALFPSPPLPLHIQT